MSKIKCHDCGKTAEGKSAEEMRDLLKDVKRQLRALCNFPPSGKIIVLCEACVTKMKKAREAN